MKGNSNLYNLSASRTPPAERLFTKSQVATLCGVSFSLVVKWVRRGHLLDADPTEGRGAIRAGDLVEFLRSRGRPIPEVVLHPSGLRALIVEDDTSMANAIERTLVRTGFETSVVGSAAEAVTELKSQRYHLLTLDLRLRDVDGEYLLSCMKAWPGADLPKVLLISGRSDSELQRALWMGGSAFLRKPFAADQLIAVIDDLMALAA